MDRCFELFTFSGLLSLTVCVWQCLCTLREVEMGYVLRPVHCVHVGSKLITGFFPVAVCPELPIETIDFLMGNDIAGSKMTPSLEILDSLQLPRGRQVKSKKTGQCPAGVITHARACKKSPKDNDVRLSDSMLMPIFLGEAETVTVPSFPTEITAKLRGKKMLHSSLTRISWCINGLPPLLLMPTRVWLNT